MYNDFFEDDFVGISTIHARAKEAKKNAFFETPDHSNTFKKKEEIKKVTFQEIEETAEKEKFELNSDNEEQEKTIKVLLWINDLSSFFYGIGENGELLTITSELIAKDFVVDEYKYESFMKEPKFENLERLNKEIYSFVAMLKYGYRYSIEIIEKQ